MKHTRLSKINGRFVVYLEKGEPINNTIEAFCISHEIVHASYTGIGAIHNIDIAQYNPQKKDYSHRMFAETHELVSLIGNFGFVKNNTDADKWFAHTHISISNEKAEVFGGHLFEAEVRAVVEIYLTAYEKPLTRTFDVDLGLNTMDLRCCKDITY